VIDAAIPDAMLLTTDECFAQEVPTIKYRPHMLAELKTKTENTYINTNYFQKILHG
jgi:hypothetical protein